MASVEASSLPDFLKPFHARATLAEERLAKLEAAVKARAGKKVEADPNSELLISLLELRENLEKVREEHAAEREQVSSESSVSLSNTNFVALGEVAFSHSNIVRGRRKQLRKEAESHALQNVREEHVAEKEQLRKELEKLAQENAKLQYRVIHLVRAMRDGDNKLGMATMAPAD